jgi:hypothetical protein
MSGVCEQPAKGSLQMMMSPARQPLIGIHEWVMLMKK